MKNSLSPSVLQNTLNTKKKLFEKLAESVFNDLVWPRFAETFKSEENLNEAIDKIRSGEIGYVTVEGKEVSIDLSQ